MDMSVYQKISRIKVEYEKCRSVFISGQEMFEILQGMGATALDLILLQDISEDLVQDPTLEFRKSRNGRYCYNSEEREVYRTKFQPFILSEEDDFVRHDSNTVREFRGLSEDLQNNTAFQNLLIFKHLICHDMSIKERQGLDYETCKWICTVFNLRTITSKDFLGEPALEGVHSDGVDHTMTTLLKHNNMTLDSAKTFIHAMEEKNSTRWSDTTPEYLLGSHQHLKYLDTLIVVDHERKHSLSPVHASDLDKEATRDMLIFFTRKPATKSHVSYPYDSQEAHPDYPISLKLPEFI